MVRVQVLSINFIQLVILLCPLHCFGHMGHDHGNEEEVDPKWADSHMLPLKQEVGVDLKWISSDKDMVKMKMSCKTEGYLAVGFCPIWQGSMKDCDIVLGWVDNQSGTPYLYDYHATGNTIPVLDETQDYTVVEGSQKDGVTSITFTRKWNTGDEFNDADLEHNSVHVIYAWHPEDPTSSEQFRRHAVGSRGHTLSPVAFKDHKPSDNKDHQNQKSAAAISVSTFMTLFLSHFAIYFLL